jgi:hypothetical protein
MGYGCKTLRLATKKDIDRVLLDSDIWKRSKGDADITREEFRPPESWLYMTESGNELLVLDDKGYIHPNFLPESKPKAFFVIKRFINLLFDAGVRVLKARIPEKYENTVRMAKLLGFEHVYSRCDKLYFILRCEK